MSGQITTNAPVLQTLILRLRAPVDRRSIERAQLHVLDWLGCAIKGAREPDATGFLSDVNDSLSAKCRRFLRQGVHPGISQRTGWRDALEANAACGNIMEMDDLDRASILHPGPVIVPAAIAVAEHIGASGEQLLGAIVRGYEATIRIGRALGTRHYAFFHNTSTCGAFGAAAAAADLLQLTAEQTVWALANAGSRTGGLWQMRHETCETKSLHNVQAAQCGVQAAMLAAQGVRGPATLLEGPQGLFAAMSPGASAAEVVAGFDRDWLIHEVSFKPWPACRHVHPTIDAALALRTKIKDWRQIESIVASTYKSAIDFCDKLNPKTTNQAKFSLQHCTAVALINGAPQLEHFDVAQLECADLVALRQRIKIEESIALTEAFPQHYGAHLRLKMVDGTIFEHLQSDAKGDPELPLSQHDIEIKANTLLQASGSHNNGQLIAATLKLYEAESLYAWTELWP
jgi:2-methylcitrate dehydratase PrpD